MMLHTLSKILAGTLVVFFCQFSSAEEPVRVDPNLRITVQIHSYSPGEVQDGFLRGAPDLRLAFMIHGRITKMEFIKVSESVTVNADNTPVNQTIVVTGDEINAVLDEMPPEYVSSNPKFRIELQEVDDASNLDSEHIDHQEFPLTSILDDLSEPSTIRWIDIDNIAFSMFLPGTHAEVRYTIQADLM